MNRERWIRYFFREFDHPWLEWLETVVISLFAVAIGFWVQPEDPFCVHAEFPWPLLAPILLSLRYGAGPGTLSMLIFVGFFALGNGTIFQVQDTPKSYFLGGILVSLLCGEFSSAWQTRVRRRDKIAFYVDERLERLTQRHYLLTLSHDRLEQAQISRPVTLRDGMIQLQQLTAADPNAALPAAEAFLAIVAQYCQVECASLHEVDAQGRVGHRAIAQVGEAPALVEDDPMLRCALEKEKLCHIQQDQLMEDIPSRYLMVAPIKPSNRPVIGVILIDKLPFFALHADTVKTLSTLCIYYADTLAIRQDGSQLRRAIPDCPPPFAAELDNLDRVFRETDIPSALVALVFGPHPHRDDMLFQIERQRRALDVQWSLPIGESRVLLTLMPLANSSAVAGYQARINSWLTQHYGVTDLDELQVVSHMVPVGQHDAQSTLRQLLSMCGRHD